MCEPAYQELKASEITTVKGEDGTPDAGITAVVIAGKALGHESKVYTRNPTHYIHFKMKKNSRLQQPIPAGHNSFVYV
jgi:redox-sensitive bicupin YhaK (pirin superfamily)